MEGVEPTTTTTREREVSEESLDELMLGMVRKPLYGVHPRRANRSVTMWRGAVCVPVDAKLPEAFRVLIDEKRVVGARRDRKKQVLWLH